MKLTTFDRLAIKINEDTGYQLEGFRRLYHGIHQRSSGAFVWTAKIKDGVIEFGSTVSATELLKQPKIGLIGGPRLLSLSDTLSSYELI